MRRTLALAALLPAALLALAGCSSKLDTDKAEGQIQKGIEQQTGVQITSVTCPDDVEAKKGDRFTCTAKAEDGTTATVNVTQRDDEGNVVWRLRGQK